MSLSAPLLPLMLSVPTAAAGAVEPVVVLEERGAFATVYVVDEGPLRYLRFDSPHGDDQSVIDKRDPARVPMDYLRVVSAALAYDDGDGRALVVGVGGGSFPMLIARTKPRYLVDAVDVDRLVLDVARQHFGLRAGPAGGTNITLHAADGAAFIASAAHTYDLILLDAYGADGIPEHLATAAFFASVRKRTAPRGVVVINIAVGDDAVPRRVARAFHDAFPACLRLVGKSADNIVLVGFPALADVRKPVPLPESAAGDVVDYAGCALPAAPLVSP